MARKERSAWDGSSTSSRGARVHPNRPLGSARRKRAARGSVGGRYCYLQRGWGLVNPTGLKFVKPLRSYSIAGSGKRAGKIDDAVGAAFAVLECAIERGYELKLPLDSCIEGPHFANALLCLVARGYAELCSPQYPRRRRLSEGPVPLRFERCSTDIRDFHSERNVVQRHSTLDETGAVF